MLAAIEFDDKLWVQADKIRNIRTDRVLSAEAYAQLIAAEVMPEFFFCLRQIAAELARLVERCGARKMQGRFSIRRLCRGCPHPNPPPLGEGVPPS